MSASDDPGCLASLFRLAWISALLVLGLLAMVYLAKSLGLESNERMRYDPSIRQMVSD